MGRSIEELDPIIQPLVKAFVALCADLGHPVRLSCTYRSRRDQQQLFDMGRSMAIPGRSWHQHRRAFDVYFNKKGDIYDGPWESIGRIGEIMGFEWGGRWKKLVDKPHFQYTEGQTIDEFIAKEKENG